MNSVVGRQFVGEASNEVGTYRAMPTENDYKLTNLLATVVHTRERGVAGFNLLDTILHR